MENMTFALLILGAWLLVVWGVLGVCRAASRGDDPHVGRISERGPGDAQRPRFQQSMPSGTPPDRGVNRAPSVSRA